MLGFETWVGITRLETSRGEKEADQERENE
jgi:hypothetical protein